MSYLGGWGRDSQPGSQKMSIGVSVGSVAKPRSGKEAGAAVSGAAAAEKRPSSVQDLTVERNDTVKLGFKGSATVSRSNVDVQEGFARVNAALTAANPTEKQASRQGGTSVLRPTLSAAGTGKKMGQENSLAEDGKRVGLDGRFTESDIRNEAVKNVQQGQPNDTEGASKETLRMKLRQILGTGQAASQMFGDSREEMIPEEIPVDGERHKPRQNSDSIETDSEDVEVTNERPITQARARKRAPASTRLKNLKPKPLTHVKEEKQGNDIFSFSEKSPVTRGGLALDRNGRGKRNRGIKSSVIQFPVTGLKSVQKVSAGGEKPAPVEKLPSRSVTTSPSPQGFLDENHKPEETMQKSFSPPPPVRDEDELPDAENLDPPETPEHQKSFGTLYPAQDKDASNSPLFKRSTLLGSPVGLSQPNKDKKQHVQISSRAAECSIPEDKYSSKSSPSSEKGYSDSSDDTFVPEDTPATAKESSVEGKSAEKEDFTSDGTEEFLSANKDEVQTSSGVGLFETPMFKQKKQHGSHSGDLNDFSHAYANPKGAGLFEAPMFKQGKRRRSHSGDLDDFSHGFTNPKAVRPTYDIFMEPLEGNAEDGLARVVSLLSLALEKVKNKMMLVTNKRCSNILISVTEEIYSQLQNVESQIQNDLGNFTKLKSSKRKHLEARLQEQQEQLKVIHQKFKEDIYRYLQDCRGTMEGLETQHLELKGAIERQKGVHSKLLLQTEAAVEIHLNDAQRRMLSVHKMSRRRMQELKNAIAECFQTAD